MLVIPKLVTKIFRTRHSELQSLKFRYSREVFLRGDFERLPLLFMLFTEYGGYFSDPDLKSTKRLDDICLQFDAMFALHPYLFGLAALNKHFFLFLILFFSFMVI